MSANNIESAKDHMKCPCFQLHDQGIDLSKSSLLTHCLACCTELHWLRSSPRHLVPLHARLIHTQPVHFFFLSETVSSDTVRCTVTARQALTHRRRDKPKVSNFFFASINDQPFFFFLLPLVQLSSSMLLLVSLCCRNVCRRLRLNCWFFFC